MSDLATTYMGLALKNPIIVSSSSLTNSADKVRQCERAGAAAVVLKSLFEEQIQADTERLEEESWPFSHPEAYDYVRHMGMQMGEEDYLELIRGCKKSVAIPVIASLNCVSPKWWNDYAVRIAQAGADALELNIAVAPTSPDQAPEQVERLYLSIVETVSRRVRIPIAVKIGPFFTSLPRMARELKRAGASALVLFNRFFQLDLDLERQEPVPGVRFSAPEEIYLSLRWIAILSPQVGCDLAAATGVHDGKAVAKQLLAGARAVQVCSVLYQKGVDHIKEMLAELQTWMKDQGYSSLEDFRGKASQELSGKPEAFTRLQYIKAFTGIE